MRAVQKEAAGVIMNHITRAEAPPGTRSRMKVKDALTLLEKTADLDPDAITTDMMLKAFSSRPGVIGLLNGLRSTHVGAEGMDEELGYNLSDYQLSNDPMPDADFQTEIAQLLARAFRSTLHPSDGRECELPKIEALAETIAHILRGASIPEPHAMRKEVSGLVRKVIEGLRRDPVEQGNTALIIDEDKGVVFKVVPTRFEMSFARTQLQMEWLHVPGSADLIAILQAASDVDSASDLGSGSEEEDEEETPPRPAASYKSANQDDGGAQPAETVSAADFNKLSDSFKKARKQERSDKAKQLAAEAERDLETRSQFEGITKEIAALTQLVNAAINGSLLSPAATPPLPISLRPFSSSQVKDFRDRVHGRTTSPKGFMDLLNEMSELSGGTEGAMAAMEDLTEMGPRDEGESREEARPPPHTTRATSPAAATGHTGLGRASPPLAASGTQSPLEIASPDPLVRFGAVRDTPSIDGSGRVVTQSSPQFFALIGLSFDTRTGKHLNSQGQALHNSHVTLQTCETAYLLANPSITMYLQGKPIEKMVLLAAGPVGRVITFRNVSAQSIPTIALLAKINATPTSLHLWIVEAKRSCAYADEPVEHLLGVGSAEGKHLIRLTTGIRDFFFRALAGVQDTLERCIHSEGKEGGTALFQRLMQIIEDTLVMHSEYTESAVSKVNVTEYALSSLFPNNGQNNKTYGIDTQCMVATQRPQNGGLSAEMKLERCMARFRLGFDAERTGLSSVGQPVLRIDSNGAQHSWFAEASKAAAVDVKAGAGRLTAFEQEISYVNAVSGKGPASAPKARSGKVRSCEFCPLFNTVGGHESLLCDNFRKFLSSAQSPGGQAPATEDQAYEAAWEHQKKVNATLVQTLIREKFWVETLGPILPKGRFYSPM